MLQELVEPQFGQPCPELAQAGDNTYLRGYWQNVDYFGDAETLLRQDFTFRPAIAEEDGGAGTTDSRVRRAGRLGARAPQRLRQRSRSAGANGNARARVLQPGARRTRFRRRQRAPVRLHRRSGVVHEASTSERPGRRGRGNARRGRQVGVDHAPDDALRPSRPREQQLQLVGRVAEPPARRRSSSRRARGYRTPAGTRAAGSRPTGSGSTVAFTRQTSRRRR